MVAGEDPVGEMDQPGLRGAMIDDCRHALETGESALQRYGNVECYVEAIRPAAAVHLRHRPRRGAHRPARARDRLGRRGGAPDQPRHASRFSQADEVLVGTAADLAARVDECDRAVCLVMSHRYELDRDNLGVLLGTHAHYIGVPGPRHRTAKMLEELCLGTYDDPRLRAPVGLDLGAETAHEQALAIIAEIQAVLRHAPAVSHLPVRHALVA